MKRRRSDDTENEGISAMVVVASRDKRATINHRRSPSSLTSDPEYLIRCRVENVQKKVASDSVNPAHVISTEVSSDSKTTSKSTPTTVTHKRKKRDAAKAFVNMPSDNRNQMTPISTAVSCVSKTSTKSTRAVFKAKRTKQKTHSESKDATSPISTTVSSVSKTTTKSTRIILKAKRTKKQDIAPNDINSTILIPTVTSIAKSTTKITVKKSKRKKQDTAKEFFSRKQGLKKILKLPQLLPLIQPLAEKVSFWRYHAFNLAHLHVHRLIDSKLPLHFDQTDVDHTIQLVANSRSKNVELTKSYNIYKPLFPSLMAIPEDTKTERTGAAVYACIQVREEFLTMASNNVLTNFYPRHTKWLEMRITGFHIKNDIDMPDRGTIKRFAYWLYKLTTMDMVKETALSKQGRKKESETESKRESSSTSSKVQHWLNDMDAYVDTQPKSKLYRTFVNAITKEVTRVLDRIITIPVKKVKSTKKVSKKTSTSSPKLQETKEVKKTKTKIVVVDQRTVPVNDSKLAKNWLHYLPWLAKINRDFEKWHQLVQAKQKVGELKSGEAGKLLRGTKLSSIIPRANIGIAHIVIDNRVLFSLLKQLSVEGLPATESEFVADKHRWWSYAFKKHELGNLRKEPKCYIKTDGVAASIVYLRPKRPTTEPDIVTSQPTDPKEISTVSFKKIHLPDGTPSIGLDPGSQQIFYTHSGQGDPAKRITSNMSNKEYRHLSGANKRFRLAHVWNDQLNVLLGKGVVTFTTNKMRKERRKKDVFGESKETKEIDVLDTSDVDNYLMDENKEEKVQVETEEDKEKPVAMTHKVSNMQDLIAYYREVGKTFQTVWDFRAKIRQRRLKFDTFIKTEEAIDFACKRILAPFKRRQKPVVAFGQARFHGVKGCPTAPTKRLYFNLKYKWKEECIVADVDEYYTSQKCHVCGAQLYDVKDEDGSKIYSLKACQECFTIHNRDRNAASNIEQAFLELNTTGNRPQHLRRSGKTTEKNRPMLSRTKQSEWQ